MQPHNPSRRRLLGGLVAGLFGWLLPKKAPAQPPQAAPHGTARTRVEPHAGTVTSYTYDATGGCLTSSASLSNHGTTTFVYDSRTRLMSITVSPPPRPPSARES